MTARRKPRPLIGTTGTAHEMRLQCAAVPSDSLKVGSYLDDRLSFRVITQQPDCVLLTEAKVRRLVKALSRWLRNRRSAK